MNSNTGWIVGPRLLTTRDGGRTWIELRHEGLGTVEAEDIFHGQHWIQFTSPETGWSVGGSGVAKTIDGGRSWTSTVVTDGQDQSLRSLFFISPHEGWVVGEDVYHTSDGGQNWKRLSPTPTGDLQRQRSLRVAPSYAILKPALWFIDAQNGLMARLDGEVYRTEDGGRTWRMTWREDRSLTDIFFFDRQNGWIVGDGGIVVRTIDGGRTWTPIFTSTNANLTSIFFISTQVGCAVGYGGTILYTRDGGMTWHEASISGLLTPSPLASVGFADDLHGWAVGGNSDPTHPSLSSPSSVVLATDDGGKSWRMVHP